MARTRIAGPDLFTGTDGTPLSSYSANWLDQNGVDGQLVLNTNAYVNAYSNVADCCWDGVGTFTSDQYAEVTLEGTWSGSDIDMIGINLSNNGGDYSTRTMYRVGYTPSTGGIQVTKIVSNGAPSNIGAVITQAFSSGDKFSAERVTNGADVDIRVYRTPSGGSLTLLATRTDSTSPLSGGKAGVCGIGSTLLLRGTDWEAGNVTADAGPTGSGALTASVATLSGTGARSVVGDGVLTVSVATITGSGGGSQNYTGSGALTASVVTIAGTATHNIMDVGGSVNLDAPAPTVSGTSAGANLTGDGALTASNATIAGIASRDHVGSGALTVSIALVSGSQQSQDHTGSGDLVVTAAVIVSGASRGYTASGALTAANARISGTNIPYNPDSKGNGGTAVAPDGTMQVLVLGLGVPVPQDAVWIDGIAHSTLGQRYIALWPANGIVTYSGGRALRPDGAQTYVNDPPQTYMAGFGYSTRGELAVTTSAGPNFVAGFSVNGGRTAVSTV